MAKARVTLLSCLAVVTGMPLYAQETAASAGISFEKIPGETNRTAAAFERRKAEILEKRGGKLGSHDWWWWGLNAFDYDQDGDQDLIAGIHGPSNGRLCPKRS